jgi:hypothetical protein
MNMNTFDVDSDEIVQFRVFSLDYREKLRVGGYLDLTDCELTGDNDVDDRRELNGWHLDTLGSDEHTICRAAVIDFAKRNGVKGLRYRINRHYYKGECVTHFWLPIKDYVLLVIALGGDFYIDRRHPDHVRKPGTPT